MTARTAVLALLCSWLVASSAPAQSPVIARSTWCFFMGRFSPSSERSCVAGRAEYVARSDILRS